jgi:predicted nucleotidyltransferase
MNKVPRDIQLAKLTERAKELRCIYEVSELLKKEDEALEDIFNKLLDKIPPAWQFTTVCEARVTYEGQVFMTEDFKETEWIQSSDIIVDNHVAGKLDVAYLQNIPGSAQPFLPEEQKLLNTIAERLGQFIFHRDLKNSLEYLREKGPAAEKDTGLLNLETDEHWKWRYHMCEKIVESLDMERFGLEGIYLIGSTKNASAGPGSDIDLLAHFRGDEIQMRELKAWMEGWGLGIAEINFMKTGYSSDGSLIDFHIITDEDIARKDSYAVMIGSLHNSARPLKVRKK